MANERSGMPPVASPDNENESWQAAAEKMKELNAVLRHDVFNQLTILVGFIQYSGDLIEDPEIREFLQKEETAGINIQKLMQFSREYQDLVITPPCWLNLAGTAREAFHPISLGEVAITCDLAGIEVFASPLIGNVLATLAGAGLESGRKPSRITISSVENSGDDTLTVILEDDSGGITDEDRATFFERRHGHTHGYGLWLAREILSLTGITVSESGTEGEGCRFELVVPPGYWRRL
ncbi:MAG: hypothetical protein APR55_10795 [Methanolinea sp. SDB]|nr:MAG: hypothetical protein APR55_10795 [Methanolinea sp. SDB]